MAKQAKTTYQIRNWGEYNRSLIQRGSITLWFSDDAIEKWFAEATGERGRPQLYSDDAILCALFIRTIYHQPLRAAQGFLNSLIQLLRLPLKAPSYTQMSRRGAALGKSLKKLSSRQPKDIVFDSTGFKVYGDGEWKVKKHGTSKRRTWRKFHIGVDPDSGEIIVAEMTTNGEGSGDAEVATELLGKLPKGIKRIFGDGAYDSFGFRCGIETIGAEPCIPPPKDAVIHEKADPAWVKRNDAIKLILGLGGDEEARKLWKKLIGYHTRSLVETSIYRLKKITGAELRSRGWAQQQLELNIKCLIINEITKLGMPKGKWI